MALFDILKGKKKKKIEEKFKKRPSKGALKQAEKSPAPVEAKAGLPRRQAGAKEGVKEGVSELGSIIISAPHITEKSTVSAERGVYVFRASSRANKVMIKKAVKEMYGFDPMKVGIVNIPSKVRSSRGKKGIKPGYKKAIIHLRVGDKIELA